MKNLIYLVIVLTFGCAARVDKVSNNIPLNTQILHHGTNGATSYEVAVESLRKQDFDYLRREGFITTTNFYKSNGEIVKFLEITW
jgi:hypothetical protein